MEKKSPWRIRPQKCELLVYHDDGDMGRLVVMHKNESRLATKGFVRFDRMPPEWYEVCGMQRLDNLYAGPAAVKSFWLKIVPVLFALTDGLPLVWQSSRDHARFYCLIAKRSPYKLTLLAGSLSGGPSLSDWTNLTGGSDDEQVLMLEMEDAK